LRHWLCTVHGQSASAAQIEELLDQVAACTTGGHGLRIKVGQGYIERSGERLRFTPAEPRPDQERFKPPSV
jgi:tRNA(Ile)-lysidine synthase